MRKINVLFMQSQTYYGADSMIHGLLMRYFNRERLNVHVACNPGTPAAPSASLKALSTIPDLQLRPVRFGVTLNERSKGAILKQTVTEGPPMLASLGGLVRYARQHQIDIIHGTEKPRDAFYGLLLARLCGARCIVHLHVKIEDWISPLTLWAMRHADGLLGVSDFVARSAVDFGYAADKTDYVLNSLDATGWDPNLDGRAVRQELGIADDVPTLAIVSRVFPWKGHTELLQSLALVKKTNPVFKLLIVGEDDPRATPGGGSYIAQLQEMTQALGLTENVIFTGFRRDVAQVMAAADIFAMPSYEEPFGVVYLEAMALRKPVIAVNSGGVPEVVEHGKAGLLAPYRDIEQMAANIVTLLNDPHLRQTMGAYGRQRLEQYFTPQRMADEVEQFYQSLLIREAKR